MSIVYTCFSSSVVIERLNCRFILDSMASFSWNRKIGEKVSKAAVEQFEAESANVEDHMNPEEVDWLHAVKRRREALLEDCEAKSKRLKNEGEVLAEQSRYVNIIQLPRLCSFPKRWVYLM